MMDDGGRVIETDVLVVGGGGSGLAAAAAAAELGREVVLLEKNADLGGSTAWSVGSVSASCTEYQLRKGIKDHPRDHLEDLKLFSGALADIDDFELGRVLTDNITATFAWLRTTGLEFIGPMLEPPHRQPRMHNVLPNSQAFPYHLGRYCRKLGVDVRLDARVTRLLKDGSRIVGVEAEIGGKQMIVKARGGVVLAAGDYSASRAYKAEFVSEEVAMVDAVNPTATGDGFRIALEQGATMVNAGRMRGPAMRFIPPPHPKLVQRIPPLRVVTRLMRWAFDNLPESILRPFMMSFLTTALGPSSELLKQGAVLVNREGRRFTDELGDSNLPVSRQPDRLAWFVFDEDMASRFTRWPYFVSTAPGVAYAYLPDYRRTRPDLFARGQSLGELARRLRMSPAALEASIEAYNADRVVEGTPGRGARPPIGKPPFYALGPAKSYVVYTNGSLRVTHRLEVLDRAGIPIPGLYAAGANGQGAMLLEGHGHHLGWAFTSGRIAGREAALYRPEPGANDRAQIRDETMARAAD